MISRVYLHVGLHRTGTTSFQYSLLENESLLRKHKIEIYKPVNRKINASELGEAVLNADKKNLGAKHRDDLFLEVRSKIHDYLEKSNLESLLISGEDLSYIRTDKECSRLKSLFDSEVLEFIILLVLRDPESWFASYRNKINELGEGGTPENNSRAFLDPGGWLTDFNQLINVMKSHFDHVVVLDYNEEDSLSGLYRSMGVDPKCVHSVVRLNASRNLLWSLRNRASRIVGNVVRRFIP